MYVKVNSIKKILATLVK